MTMSVLNNNPSNPSNPGNPGSSTIEYVERDQLQLASHRSRGIPVQTVDAHVSAPLERAELLQMKQQLHEGVRRVRELGLNPDLAKPKL